MTEGKKITVTVDGVAKQYQVGSSFQEILKDCQIEVKDQVLLAVVNHHKLKELTYKVKKDCEVHFLTYRDKDGCETYRRSCLLLMLKSFHEVLGAKHIKKIYVDFTLGKGLYCQVEGDRALTADLVLKVEDKMRDYVKEDLPIGKRSINTDAAIELFHMHGMYAKEQLFKFRRGSEANLYSLKGYEDYYYGYMVPSTGYLKYFNLVKYKDGVLLMMPDRRDPERVPEVGNHEKLFSALTESTKWEKTMNVETVGALDEEITEGHITDIMLVQEALQEKKIADLAQTIADNPKKRLIMIAGPSSSGKTTFSHRLCIQLKAHGLNPHPIAVDNYFRNREDSPKDENGNNNYEVLEAIDVDRFNKDMTDLLAGKEVLLPTFNFITGHREYKGNKLLMGEDDILVIEGIHCLNDALSYSLPKENKYKIYISALTQLNIDEHNRIPTSDGRLLRRMVRDARTRGTNAVETIQRWPSVRAGEEAYIFPFQEDADATFNSALVYELSVLKTYAEPLLFSVPRDCPEYIEAKRLLKFLDYFLAVSGDQVPNNSLLREFIGGGIFNI